MGRKADDGRGRNNGGRKAGTPNKEKPIKTFLREHSTEYFTPCIPAKDENGNPTGRMISQFDIDQAQLKPAERINAELQLLRYHTPQMQATAIDMAVEQSKHSLSERLQALSEGKEVASEED